MKEPITYRVLSIDPGANLGLTISETDLDCTYLKPLHSETIELNKHVDKFYEELAENHGHRFARVYALKQVVGDILKKWQPEVVVHETSFIRPGRVTAGMILVEYILFIRCAVDDYDPSISIVGYAPKEIKSAVKAQNMSSDKTLVLKALPKLKDLILTDIEIDKLDEHSIDSIAIGYCYIDKNKR